LIRRVIVVTLALGLAGCSRELARGFDSGVFIVGTDIVAGTYVAQHPIEGQRCRWSVLGATGTLLASGGTRLVVLTDGQQVRSSGCGLWTLSQ